MGRNRSPSRLRATGQIVTTGTVQGPPDAPYRGPALHNAGTVDEAEKLAERGPAVVEGLLEVQAMTWWWPPGTMSQPGRVITALDAGKGLGERVPSEPRCVLDGQHRYCQQLQASATPVSARYADMVEDAE